jgi:L,D-peptidoglycan transpeptidase YkuD (ErfK/YbiS/YcfS/YnhG family)
MIFTAMSDGRFVLGGKIVRCALGRGGVIEADLKREGDGASPLGVWAIRRVLYRPDKGPAPRTGLPTKALERDDGWCDAPGDPAYNRAVKLPHPASAEHMWREDEAYDLVCVLAHNDDPPVSPLGSAIFLHLAKPGHPPTEGCVALSRENMLELLSLAKLGDAMAIIRGPDTDYAPIRA